MSLYIYLLLTVFHTCMLHVYAGDTLIQDQDPTDEVRTLVSKVLTGGARNYLKKCQKLEGSPKLTAKTYTMEGNENRRRYYVKLDQSFDGGLQPVVKITKTKNRNPTFSGVSMQKADDTICYKKYSGCPYLVMCR